MNRWQGESATLSQSGGNSDTQTYLTLPTYTIVTRKTLESETLRNNKQKVPQ